MELFLSDYGNSKRCENTRPKTLCQDLLKRLCDQKHSEQLCDVELYYGQSQILVHSCVLASFSPFMMRLFLKCLQENMDWSIRIPFKIHISSLTKCKGTSRNNCMDCILKVVDFIYTGKIKLDSTHINHIVNISNNLEIENLILICQKFKLDSTDRFETGRDVEHGEKIGKTHKGLIKLDKKDESVHMDETDGSEMCTNDGVNYDLPRAESLNEVSGLSEHSNTDTDGPVLKCAQNTSVTTVGPNGDPRNKISLENNLSPISPPKIYEESLELPRKDESPNEDSNDKEELEMEQFGRIKREDEYCCKHCHASFREKVKLSQHEKVYHSRFYKCFSCNYKSYKIVHLLDHLTKSEHGEKTCSICLYEGEDKKGLKEHIEEHRHKLPFLCKICSERFRTRGEWNKHTATHSTDCPFVCNLCNLTFKRFSYLDSHIIVHHKKPKHLCEECGYTTPYHSFLERHKLKHSDKKLACPFESCDFRSSRESSMKSHAKTHGGEKPFKCSECNVDFAHEKNLRRHGRLAHGSKVFIFHCPDCKYLNSRYDKVKEHCRKSHPEDPGMLKKVEEQYRNSRETVETSERRGTSFIRQNYVRTNSRGRNATSQTDPCAKNGTDPFHLPGKSLISKVVNNSDQDSERASGKASGNGTNKQTVFLSETSGEISIISGGEGHPIAIASLTSTNLLTIGNFREGTGSVTLNESTGVLTLNNINRDSTGAVFLNESTGELSYINLNTENHESIRIGEQKPESSCEDKEPEPATLLNEETGEISTVFDGQTGNSNPNTNDDDMFDFFDIDAFNEDSFDGFDEFDEFLFDSLNPGAESENTMKNFLNEVTGELSVDDANFSQLEAAMGRPSNRHRVPQEQSGGFSTNIVWNSVPHMGLAIPDRPRTVFTETLLNEVTGELILN